MSQNTAIGVTHDEIRLVTNDERRRAQLLRLVAIDYAAARERINLTNDDEAFETLAVQDERLLNAALNFAKARGYKESK
jgi:hypothetical protein